MEIRFTKKIGWIFLIMISLSIKTMAQTIPSYVPTNGLVGWWPFNGNAQDESGNGNHGTVNGATLTSDRSGNLNKAFSLDGINSFIIVKNSSSLESVNLSISFWIQTTSYKLQQVFYKVSPNTSLNETYSVPLNFTREGTLNFDLKNNNCNPGQGWKYSSANIGSITSWTNFILTHDGLNTKFFKNGQLLNSTTGAFSISNCPGGDLLFGCDWQFKNKLNGNLDDIAIWNRALTDSEIKDLYNAGALAANPCQAKDSLELVRFKGNVQNLTWNVKDPMNSWEGVKVNASGCVTKLLLNDLGLGGTLTDITLDSLEELELFGNKFTGSVPAFSNLKKLKTLWLSNNQLSGSIPNFQLPELQSIDLANNNLSGAIPAFNLSNLMELGLANNKLTGTIPTLNTPKLAWLRLNNNALTGNIPNWTFQDLQGIYLQSNNLSGTLPDLKLNDLRHFNIDSNALQGSLKQNFPNLWEINLANNKFSSLTDLVSPSLGQAIFHNNQFLGNLNTGFSQYVNLEKLRFENNKWTFEALLPISTYLNDKKGSYSPQELIYPDTIIKANAGKSLEIDLVIDASVKENIYTWFKEGKPFKTLTGNNKLLFSTLQLADTGNYQVFITHPNLKNLTLSSRNIKIQIPCLPTQSVRNDTICAGTSVSFAGQTISKEGPYIGRFSSVQGCDSTVTLNLVVRPVINAVPMSFIEECRIFASVDVSGGISPIQYAWSNGRKEAEISDLSPETNYTLTLTDAKGCKKEISLKTPALSLPTQSVRNDTICAGTSLSFAGQTISKEGPYIGRFSSVQGCDSTVTLNLVVRPVINAVPMSFIEECRIFASVDVSGGISPIQYAWSNGRKEAEISDLSPETNYTLTLTDAKGCKKEISLKTPALKRLAIIPSYKTANCEKENGEIKLAITGTAPFLIDWGKNTLGSGDTLRTGLVSGSYTVYVKDANDCKDSLPMYLEKPTDCKPSYKVFTSFSPNDDGVNDIFTIDPLYCTSEDLATCFPNNELIIFNRWSDVVFKASPYNNTWEGEGLPEGTYYYIFTADLETKKSEKGYITLIKRQ